MQPIDTDTLPPPDSITTFWAYNQPIDPSLIFLAPSSDSVLDLIGVPRQMDSKTAATWIDMIRDRHEQVSAAITAQTLETL